MWENWGNEGKLRKRQKIKLENWANERILSEYEISFGLLNCSIVSNSQSVRLDPQLDTQKVFRAGFTHGWWMAQLLVNTCKRIHLPDRSCKNYSHCCWIVLPRRSLLNRRRFLPSAQTTKSNLILIISSDRYCSRSPHTQSKWNRPLNWPLAPGQSWMSRRSANAWVVPIGRFQFNMLVAAMLIVSSTRSNGDRGNKQTLTPWKVEQTTERNRRLISLINSRSRIFNCLIWDNSEYEVSF